MFELVSAFGNLGVPQFPRAPSSISSARSCARACRTLARWPWVCVRVLVSRPPSLGVFCAWLRRLPLPCVFPAAGVVRRD